MRTPILLSLLLMLPCPELQAREAPEGMVLVPGGEFLMGTDKGGADEGPERRVHLPAFYIDRHEVTNAQFAEFVRRSGSFETVEGPWFRYSVEGCADLIAHYEERFGVGLDSFNPDTSRRPAHVVRWRSATAARRAMAEEEVAPEVIAKLVDEQARLPVRGVSWRDAVAYAKWAGKRLPSEAEWEKAARGENGREYPWGATWAPDRCRAGLDVDAGPAPVGSHPQGASPYGGQDMAGNVWEWVANWYAEDYAASSPGARGQALDDAELPGPSKDVNLLRTPQQGRETNTRKVIRGGSWAGSERRARYDVRATRRLWSNPTYWHLDVGFRCAKDAE